jgi:hypothetical protein
MPTEQNQTQKNYTVSRTFTDTSGRQWNEGDDFEGDEKAIANALRNGNIKEEASQQPAQGQQAGQAKPQGQQGQQTSGQSGQQPKR